MIITCPACSTQFRVDGTKISAAGTKVRCARCAHVWLQTPDKALPYPGQPAAKAPAPAAAPPPPPKPAAPSMAEALAAETREIEPAPPKIISPPKPASRPAPEPVPARAPERTPERMPAERVRPPTPPRPAPTPIAAETIERPGLPIALLASLVATTLLVGGLFYGVLHYHSTISNYVPVMGRFYNAIGLVSRVKELNFQNVSYNRTFTDGVPILEIRGEIVNTADYGVDVPRIRAALRDKDGKELYKWTFGPPKSRLKGKEVSSFSSRLPSPPTEAVSLAVSFQVKGSN